jgi:hypothetical protein
MVDDRHVHEPYREAATLRRMGAERFELVQRQGMAEQEAWRDPAARFDEKIMLQDGLDTLGNDFQS